jgi:hypothetical protein
MNFPLLKKLSAVVLGVALFGVGMGWGGECKPEAEHKLKDCSEGLHVFVDGVEQEKVNGALEARWTDADNGVVGKMAFLLVGNDGKTESDMDAVGGSGRSFAGEGIGLNFLEKWQWTAGKWDDVEEGSWFAPAGWRMGEEGLVDFGKNAVDLGGLETVGLTAEQQDAWKTGMANSVLYDAWSYYYEMEVSVADVRGKTLQGTFKIGSVGPEFSVVVEGKAKVEGSELSGKLAVTGKPDAASFTVGGVSLTTSATGQSIEFAATTQQTPGNTVTWTAGTGSTTITATLSPLVEGTSYYIHARSKASSLYNAGAVVTAGPFKAGVDAATPTWTTPLIAGMDATYERDAGTVAKLSVLATASDLATEPPTTGKAGEISYQWYSRAALDNGNENTSIAGSPINGETEKDFTPPVTSVGVVYYYVIATNTNSAATGDQEKTLESAVHVKITVTVPTYMVTFNAALGEVVGTAGGTIAATRPGATADADPVVVGTGTKVTENVSVTFTATPTSAEYQVADWKVNDVLLGRTDLTISRTITAEIKVQVVFEKKTYSIAVSKGYADVAKAAKGDVVNLVADAPATGQVFDVWTVSASTAGTPTFTTENKAKAITSFTMGGGAISLTATYKAAPAYTYSLSVTTDNRGTTAHSVTGTAGANPNAVTITPPATTGGEVTVTATPKQVASGSFTFLRWEVTGVTGLTEDDLTKSPLKFVMPAQHVTVKATFKPVIGTPTISGKDGWNMGAILAGSPGWNYTLVVDAKSPLTSTYQWYRSSTAAVPTPHTSGTLLSGEVKETYKLPNTLESGTYYYYCVVKSAGADDAYNSPAQEIIVRMNPNKPTSASIAMGNHAIDFTATGVKKVTMPSSVISGTVVSGGTFSYVSITYAAKSGNALTQGFAPITYEAVAGSNSWDLGVDYAGVYDVKVTVKNNSYQFSKDITFTVNRRNVADGWITVSAGANASYDGDAKEPDYAVKDGNYLLDPTEPGGDFTVVKKGDAVYDKNSKIDWTNASTGAIFKIVGVGNYTGTAQKTFVIGKKAITLDVENSTYGGSSDFQKYYDGTTDLPLAGAAPIDIKFLGLATVDESAGLAYGKDYTLKNAKFTGAAVSTANQKVTATIALEADGPKSKNYQIVGTAATFSKSAAILKATPTQADFNVTGLTPSLPYLYNNSSTGRTVTVSWAAPRVNTGERSPLKVEYAGSATVPTAVGVYPVTVYVDDGGANYNTAPVTLSPAYTIEAERVPSVTVVADTTTYEAMAFSVTAKTAKPLYEGTDTEVPGTFAYQWYKIENGEAEGKAVAGATRETLNLGTTLKRGTHTYYVVATMTSTVQVQTKVQSNNVSINVREPQRFLGAVMVDVTTAAPSFVYTGEDLQIETQAILVTTAEGTQLTYDQDYTIELDNIKNAGQGIVTVIGKNDYKGSFTTTFDIEKKEVSVGDLTYVPVVEYDGTAKPVRVSAKEPMSGLGKVTVLYDGKEEAPTDFKEGGYALTVNIERGMNFLDSTGIDLGKLTIMKKRLGVADFTFSIPDTVRWNGQAQPIGTVTQKGTWNIGETEVIYTNSRGAEVEPIDSGTYTVSLYVEGSANISPALLKLGEYTIHHENWVKVASADRVIPKPVVTEEAAVAPVAKVAASFTAGPNVARAGETVKFFSSKPVKSGTLYVFDANGNAVAKVQAKSGTGAIGSLLVKSEGTYAVKGALAGKDGTRVKVSTLFTVVR